MRFNKCPHCGNRINPASILGGVKTKAKAKSSRENGKLGGRPKKLKSGVWKEQG